MGAYIIKCGEIVQNADGSIKEIHVTADLETGNGSTADGKKIKGTIHWLSVEYAEEAAVVLYDRLFTVENMNEVDSSDYDKYLNPDSAVKLEKVKIEKALADAQPGENSNLSGTGITVRTPKTRTRSTALWYSRTVSRRNKAFGLPIVQKSPSHSETVLKFPPKKNIS